MKNLLHLSIFLFLILNIKSQTPNFMWVTGSTNTQQKGIYGSKYIGSTNNCPGTRTTRSCWTDKSGNFWLFGEYATDSTGLNDYINDVWKYNRLTNEWTWMAGSPIVTSNAAASYHGTMGVPSASTTPGGRIDCATWTDTTGNLWLYGGQGLDIMGNYGELSDLWKFNTTTNQWTWVKGSGLRNQTGVYGTKGIPSPSNIPPARCKSYTWVDKKGFLWLFGGDGNSTLNQSIWQNDLWRYNVNTNQWTWMSGDNFCCTRSKYGIKGVTTSTNMPGAREDGISWVDTTGNFWLFGGVANAYSGGGTFNDLWKYEVSLNQWTWVSGDSIKNLGSKYGIKGIASTTNCPGARTDSFTWTDTIGNLYLYGGTGLDSNNVSTGSLSDFWKYNIALNQWTWLAGPKTIAQTVVYGTKGIASVTNTPGARNTGGFWRDTNGDFWLFGGSFIPFAGQTGAKNDLWKISFCTIPSAPLNTSTVLNICTNNSATLTASGSGTLSWYNSLSGGTKLGSGNNYNTTTLTTGVYTYYVQDSTSCSISQRTAITITVNPLPTLSVSSTSSLLCVGQTATINVSGAISYTWSTSATNPNIIISPTISTTYSVSGTDGNGCKNSATITQSVSACTNLNFYQQTDLGLDIYPNPSSGELNIKSNTEIELKLINELGQEVHSIILNKANEFKIEIKDLSAGVYFLKGKNKNEIISKKIIITN